jgi:AraC-like DNA-binding protein
MLEVTAAAFSEEMGKHQLPETAGGSAELRFKELIQAMPDSELVNHTPEQLAQLCGCSPRHLSRLFRKHFGSTIRSRQTELRLLKAKRLLAETNAKIIHVAHESGYRHLGLFNLMFKKYLGMTPSEWRSAHTGSGAKLSSLLVLSAMLAGLAVCAPARAAVNRRMAVSETRRQQEYGAEGRGIMSEQASAFAHDFHRTAIELSPVH